MDLLSLKLSWKTISSYWWENSRRNNNNNKSNKGDSLSPLLLIIPMMPLNHIVRKYTAGYKLSRSQEPVNHLMYMDDIKLFAKNEKELETLIHAVRIYSQDRGMEFDIQKWLVCWLVAWVLWRINLCRLFNAKSIFM